MEYNSVAVPWALNVNKRSVREMVSYYETEMSPFWWFSWWRHQRETFSALQAFCAGKSPVTGEFPVQRPVTRSFGAFFDLCLNKWLSKQWGRRWFETASRSLWRHCNVFHWLHRKLSKWHFRFNMRLVHCGVCATGESELVTWAHVGYPACALENNTLSTFSTFIDAVSLNAITSTQDSELTDI